MPAIIAAQNVQKHFRQPKRRAGLGGALTSLFSREFTEVRAVDGISFAIEPGEAVGYLGPNGAGVGEGHRATVRSIMLVYSL
jgi:ABC-2 type transport system ATP-binding protein